MPLGLKQKPWTGGAERFQDMMESDRVQDKIGLTRKAQNKDAPIAWGIAYDKPKAPVNEYGLKESVYSAKKKVLEATEENSPEYNIAEQIVDSMASNFLGVRPYKYGMTQHEKDIQKQREGVNLELQKAHKALMPALRAAANVESENYADLEEFAKHMNRNQPIFGAITNIKRSDEVEPKFNPNTGKESDFAGVPLYSFSYTDPNTGKTDQFEKMSLPELVETYRDNLPESDAMQLTRLAARGQVEDDLKRDFAATGITSITPVGTEKGTGRKMYRFKTKGGEVYHGPGMKNENGEMIIVPSENIEFTADNTKAISPYQKATLGIKKLELGLKQDAARKKGTITTPKEKVDYDKMMYELTMQNLPLGSEITQEAIWKTIMMSNGGEKVVKGKPGTPQAGKSFIQKGGELYDRYMNPVATREAKASTKPNVELRQPKKRDSGSAKLLSNIKTGLTRSKKKKEPKPDTRSFGEKTQDTLLKRKKDGSISLVDTDDFKKVGKAIYDTVEKTGDTIGVAISKFLKANNIVGTAIVNGIKKAVKAAAESQKQAKKESGF